MGNLIRRLKDLVKRLLRAAYAVAFARKVKKHKARIRKKVAGGEQVRVLFTLQYPEMWNSLRSVYEYMKNDPRFSVCVLAVPKRVGVNSKDVQFCEENAAYDFCVRNGVTVVNAWENNRWQEIRALKPDYIFIQRPYDECMPAQYSQYRLSSHGLLCYIPYGFEFVSGVHLRIEYNQTALNNLYISFAENQDIYEYCVEQSAQKLRKGTRKVYSVGYPRFDLFRELPAREEGAPVTALWLPRWSTDEANDKSYFFEYFRPLMDFFARNKQLRLIIRPHPLMFTNFVEKGILTPEEVAAYQAEVAEAENVSFDPNVDYMDTFHQSDVLISDFSSLLIEYFLTGKPIIYCGESASFNSIGKRMADGFYHVKDEQELLAVLSRAVDGEHIYKEYNQNVIREILASDEPAGHRIAELIYEDASR